MPERQLLGPRRDRDGVLEQPAEVGVVAGPRARGEAELGAERLVGEQAVKQRPVAGVGDLAGEVLEEAVELVEVAVGDGQEFARVDRRVVGAGDPLELDLRLPRRSARRGR